MTPSFRILGPLEVTVDEAPLSLRGRRERAILGILLLHVGEVVSVERLIDGVWGEARPSSAKHMVHEYVSRLRIALGDVASIATRPPGYLLEQREGELDARRFADLSALARAAARDESHEDALRTYEAALELWRGDALADVGLEGHAQLDAARLDEERALVADERVECALALGRHVSLIPELTHRVERAPLRERSRAQLMLALYRSGRQTEALARYREGRALLIDQAGVEPGSELRELERAILAQDPALDATPASGRPPTGDTRPRPRAIRRRRVVAAIAATGVLLVAVLLAIALLVGRSGHRSALTHVHANSVVSIDPTTNRLVSQVAVETGPGRIAAGFDSLWVVNAFDSTVSRVDPATGTVEETIQVGGDPTAIAVADGFVWVTCTGTSSVDQIDPQVQRPVKRIPVGNGPSAIAATPGELWVTNRLDDTVTEIDSKTGKAHTPIDAGASPSDIVYGFGALWIANESSSSVTRLDPASGRLEQVTVEDGPESVAIGDGSVWVANSLDRTVSRIDPRRNAVTFTIPVGQGPSSLLVRDGSVWVADSYGGQIVRIDAATNRVVRRISTGSEPQGLAAIGGRLWSSVRETATAHRGGTLRLFLLHAPGSLDTGTEFDTTWPAAVGDGLVAFKRVGGLDGGTLVPDLATSLPRPSDDGRTYSFQLRRGLRYSNGVALRASDVRRALERDFRINSPTATFLGDFVGSELVGGASCSSTHCDLSRGITTDDRTGTVVLHLLKPDPELFYRLALPYAYPVPAGVSMTRPQRLGVPGTGPYRIGSYRHDQLVLVRNPHFRAWSDAAQPDGYPDRLVISYRSELGTELTQVERGTSDFMESPLPASRVDEIQTRFAARVHVFPASKTYAMFLNTAVPPFDNLKARRAVAFAVDRGSALAGFGGTEGAAVTCQIVPAGMNGYRPYCPYTTHPTRNGIWTGADLSTARKLVAESGTRGQKVVFRTGPFPLQRVIGALAKKTLTELGYRVTLKVYSDDDAFFAAINDSRARPQAGFYAWEQDYPAASNFLTLFSCHSFVRASTNNVNDAEICDPRLDRAIDTARARETTDSPARSNARWAAIDRLVTDLAPWVPIVNEREVAFVSRRVGNVQANPQWGVLVDQMWVR